MEQSNDNGNLGAKMQNQFYHNFENSNEQPKSKAVTKQKLKFPIKIESLEVFNQHTTDQEETLDRN